MATLIAYGNIQQNYPLTAIPDSLLTDKLRQKPNQNPRIQQRHRCRWVAHFLLWELLKKAQLDTALLRQIFHTQSGRPQFPFEHIDFNLSHSENWVAVILQSNSNQEKSAVGIDLEFPQKVRPYSSLLQHFASQQEQQWFAQQPNPESAFYRIWCSREALLKSQGIGIAKLSEVKHNPETLQLHSSHCPIGELLFTDELPFYFSLFSNQPLNTAEYYVWDNERLSPQTLNQSLIYRVNK